MRLVGGRLDAGSGVMPPNPRLWVLAERFAEPASR
jgi:hypothetical protein